MVQGLKLGPNDGEEPGFGVCYTPSLAAQAASSLRLEVLEPLPYRQGNCTTVLAHCAASRVFSIPLHRQ